MVEDCQRCFKWPTENAFGLTCLLWYTSPSYPIQLEHLLGWLMGKKSVKEEKHKK